MFQLCSSRPKKTRLKTLKGGTEFVHQKGGTEFVSHTGILCQDSLGVFLLSFPGLNYFD